MERLVAVRGLPLAVVQRRRWSCSSSRSSSARSTGRRKLWRGVSDVRVAQPEPYFDPRLPDRAAMDGVPAGLTSTPSCARNGFHVREATDADGTRFLYGDRHQYTKMATLFTHPGLILFLDRGRGDLAARRRAGPGRRRGRVADRPADRHAGSAAGQEHRLRGARLRHRRSRPTSRPTSRSTRTASRSRARRSGSTTRCRSAATPSTRTGSGRRRTSCSRRPPVRSCGTPRCR